MQLQESDKNTGDGRQRMRGQTGGGETGAIPIQFNLVHADKIELNGNGVTAPLQRKCIESSPHCQSGKGRVTKGYE